MNEWILVVDDDANNLRTASHILMEQHMRASCVKSGEDALRFLGGGDKRPDLILLDIHMPGLDGFETLARIRQIPALDSVPVVFLTADEDADTEVRGLKAGALDFIKKPFVPEVFLARVRHTVEYSRLRNDLEQQVQEKTHAVIEQQEAFTRLSMQVVEALAAAIDAKDKYTNGHSKRVAEYAREISRRYGYTEAQQDEIYMMGLLHDVGKIGVPDAVINKPARLTDEEFAIIKTHPAIGANILSKTEEMPGLVIGARSHHERFDGRGYPDGMRGADIPEPARIIAVADSYDAMTSRRSYRDALPQATVRAEIERGRGTQFDPQFADIMLQMMDEDTDFKLRGQ